MASQTPLADLPFQPSFSDLFLKHPLYAPLEMREPQDTAYLTNFTLKAHQLDCYCIHCEKESTFHQAQTEAGPTGNIHIFHNRLLAFLFRCTRNKRHEMRIMFVLEDLNLIKIGQYPSASDSEFAEIGKYKALLGKDKFKELKHAVILSSHHFGIGSFTYLRRIIETFIDKAKLRAEQEPGWNEEEYNRKRVVEKFDAVKKFLPETLAKNTVIYGLLSKGIHSLTEEECNEAFPVVYSVVKLSLNDELRQSEEKKDKREIQHALGELASKHAPKSKTKKP